MTKINNPRNPGICIKKTSTEELSEQLFQEEVHDPEKIKERAKVLRASAPSGAASSSKPKKQKKGWRFDRSWLVTSM